MKRIRECEFLEKLEEHIDLSEYHEEIISWMDDTNTADDFEYTSEFIQRYYEVETMIEDGDVEVEGWIVDEELEEE